MQTTISTNVIVILSDDQGYGDIQAYGNQHLRTPHLNRLADGGVTFDQHYTASPICAPARASFLTGMYNHRTAALSVESNRGLDRIHEKIPLIGNYYQRNGYRTGMIGKWHNGTLESTHHPLNRGFDEFVGFLHGGMNYYDWAIYYNDQLTQSNGRYLTHVFADEAVSFISRQKNQPFFLYLAFNAPHAPFEAPEETIERYRTQGLDEGVARIYAMIEEMDSGIGKVLDSLDEFGLQDNTLVLFTSDNGPLLGRRGELNLSRYNGPFRGAKTKVLEGGIRVPAILRWPAGTDEKITTTEMIHFTDWLPTLLDATAIKPLDGISLDGRSCLPVIRGDSRHQSLKRFWQFNRYDPVPRCNAAMRDGDWKLYWPDIPEAMAKIPSDENIYKELLKHPSFIASANLDNPSVERQIPTPGKPQLFNLKDDPCESIDLADFLPDVTNRMILELDNWFDGVESERRKLLEQ